MCVSESSVVVVGSEAGRDHVASDPIVFVIHVEFEESVEEDRDDHASETFDLSTGVVRKASVVNILKILDQLAHLIPLVVRRALEVGDLLHLEGLGPRWLLGDWWGGTRGLFGRRGGGLGGLCGVFRVRLLRGRGGGVGGSGGGRSPILGAGVFVISRAEETRFVQKSHVLLFRNMVRSGRGGRRVVGQEYTGGDEGGHEKADEGVLGAAVDPRAADGGLGGSTTGTDCALLARGGSSLACRRTTSIGYGTLPGTSGGGFSA